MGSIKQTILTAEEVQFLLHYNKELFAELMGPARKHMRDLNLNQVNLSSFWTPLMNSLPVEEPRWPLPEPGSQKCPVPWKTREQFIQRLKELDPDARVVDCHP